jgi:hypothetical protein
MKKLPGTKSVSNKPVVKPTGKTPSMKTTGKKMEGDLPKLKKKAR